MSPCPRGRRFGEPAQVPCSPQLVSAWGESPRCQFCKAKVRVSREACDHHVRCSNEHDDRAGAPLSFCGLCGVGLAASVALPGTYARRWHAGKVLDALPPGHPDYVVGSEKAALAAAKKHGISLETGTFATQADRKKLWGDMNKVREWDRNRVGITPGTTLENQRIKGPRIHPGMTGDARDTKAFNRDLKRQKAKRYSRR